MNFGRVKSVKKIEINLRKSSQPWEQMITKGKIDTTKKKSCVFIVFVCLEKMFLYTGCVIINGIHGNIP